MRSWRSVLRLKQVYDVLRSRSAVVDRLPIGFCESETPKVDRASDELPVHLRLAVPNIQPTVKHLVATPPSLMWALAVTMEFCRLQSKETMKNSQSNLTVETIGVIENWVEFFVYGSLLTDESIKPNFEKSVWVSNSV